MALRPDHVLNGYQNATAAIRARVLAYAQAVWSGSANYRDADVDKLVKRIVPVVQSGQMQVAMLTNAYIGQMAALAGVKAPTNVDRSVVDYRGVPADEVYRRPAVETYTALSKGTPYLDAVAAGLSRLESIVSTDIQQAKNRQAQRSFSGSGFDYTIRVLTGRENCALCVIASTQRYTKKTLMPIHPGCDCGQKGMKAGEDPGQVINPDLLELTHSAVEAKVGMTDRGARYLTGDNPVSDYLDLIVSNEHGELGPTLAWRSDHFTGPAEIAALAH